MSKLNTRALSDCPTFWVSKIEIFFNYRRIARVLKTRVAGGRGEGGWRGMLPQKVLKSWFSETAFLAFWEENCCLKCSIKQLLFSCLFMFACLRVQVLDPGAHVSFFFLDISFKYTLFLCKYHKNSYDMKYRNRCQNPDFFLSRSHFGRDSGFQAKSRKSRRDRDSYSNTTEFLPDRGIAALPHFFGKCRALQLA